MLAVERLALAVGDRGFAAQSRHTFEIGRRSLYEHLWTGEYFRAWWFDGRPFPDALHADTLHGQLWAFLPDLGLVADEAKLKSHLAAEAKLNGSLFGLRVMRGADPQNPSAENAVPSSPDEESRPRDNLVWEAGSLDWCA